MSKSTRIALAAVGLAAIGVVLAPAVSADAAPATSNVQICDAGNSNYQSYLVVPAQGSVATVLTDPGTCHSMPVASAGETVQVFGQYEGATFYLGSFTSDGASQIAVTQGTPQTASYTVYG